MTSLLFWFWKFNVSTPDLGSRLYQWFNILWDTQNRIMSVDQLTRMDENNVCNSSKRLIVKILTRLSLVVETERFAVM